MSHEVETMAWANQVPWHGLGVEVPDNITIPRMAKRAGLDWEVHSVPLMTRPTDEFPESIDVDTNFAQVRSTDNKILTVTGSDWKPVQNRDALEFFRDFVGEGGGKLETAGSLRGGTVVWGLCNLGDSFTVSRGDEVRGYLLLMVPHIWGRSLMARVTPVRVVCANTMAMALEGSAVIERRWSHAQEFNPKAAAQSMGLVRENFEQTCTLFKQLHKLNLTEDEVVEILQPTFMPKVEDPKELLDGTVPLSRTMSQILDSYREAPGHERTGWGVLNAVTHWADHVTVSDQDRRMTSAWLGGNSTRKRKVLRTLEKKLETV